MLEVTYEDCRHFRDTCLKLPAHRTKKPEYRGKSLIDLANLGLPPSKCLEPKTIKDHLSNLNGFFKWLKVTKRIIDNPVEGVNILAEPNSYSPFTTIDLQRIFDSPLYQPDSIYAKRYGKRSNWWLLLLAAFTGARISELCQLEVKDLKNENGTYYLSLLDDDSSAKKKILKTKAARRRVPVHSALIELGLLEYITQLPAEGRLLPGIKLGNKRPGERASKWFNEKYRAANLPGFEEAHKVFHSFRHTFIQTAVQSSADTTQLQQLVGHEMSLGATKTYAGEGYSIVQLAKLMERIEYRGLNLDALKNGAWRLIKKV